MAHAIVIPRLGWSMEEGTFVRWLKRDGEAVRRGEALFELEGEKALQEIEAVDDGVLRIPPNSPEAGSVVSVGDILGYLIAEGEPLPWQTAVAAQELDAPGDPIPRAVEIQPEGKSSSQTHTTTSRSGAESRLVITPRASRIAKELGINWTRLSGSGAGGRIRERDVRAAAETGTLRGKRLPISKRRRAIAERLVVSRQQTVPVTLTTRADATNLVNLREQFQSVGGTTVIPSYQDFITKLVAVVLRRHPLLAGRWDDDAIVLPGDDEIHIGIAVHTDDGLLVPVIRNVGSLSPIQLADYSQLLIQRARGGKLSAADLQGSVFTITNLGAFGIDAFTPTINYPEAAILGLGTIRREPVVLDDGQIVARYQLALSLTFDHRIVDGAPAARFLQDLVRAIASPSSSLLNT
jgi:pyruvate dehydrogenase E2 component (dihydrolipoamide acetyltransferase)